MKRRNKKDYIALSLLISAFVLTVVFIITCIKKKNILAALAAVAALNAAGGWWLVERRRKGGYIFDFFDENDYEVFDDEEADSASRAVRAGFHRKHASEGDGKTSKLIYEIPVDDEATEADF